jgi:hypothetical protein
VLSGLTFQIGLDIATSVSLLVSAVYLAIQINRQSAKQQAERLAKEADQQRQTLYWQRQQTYFMNYFEAIREETRRFTTLYGAAGDLAQAQARAELEDAPPEAQAESAQAFAAMENAVNSYSDWLRNFMQEILVYAPTELIDGMNRAKSIYDAAMDLAVQGEAPGGFIVRGAYEVHAELSVAARVIYAGGARGDAERAIEVAQSKLIFEDPNNPEWIAWQKLRQELYHQYDHEFEEFQAQAFERAEAKNLRRRSSAEYARRERLAKRRAGEPTA